jgi:hypothetical protein
MWKAEDGFPHLNTPSSTRMLRQERKKQINNHLTGVKDQPGQICKGSTCQYRDEG